MKSAVIITAKGTNTMPDKHLALVDGAPLICYVIWAAGLSGADSVALSTDCPELKALARFHDVDVIDRPAELATPESTHADVIFHAINQIIADIYVVLLGNTVGVTAGLIGRAIECVGQDDCDSCLSGWRAQDDHPLRALTLDTDGYVESYLGIDAGSNRQAYPPVWYYDQGVWAFRRECGLIQQGPPPWVWLGQKCRLIERDWVTGRDVHAPIDVSASEWQLKCREAMQTGRLLKDLNAAPWRVSKAT